MSLLVIGQARLSKSYVRGHVLLTIKKNGVPYGQALRNTTGLLDLIVVCVDHVSTLPSLFELTARLVGARRSVWVEDPRLTVLEKLSLRTGANVG